MRPGGARRGSGETLAKQLAEKNCKERRVSEDLIGYDLLTQDAMRSVVRAALTRAAGPRGLPGRHHFYITFRTRAPGVVLPENLKDRFPDEMTIVLEHQFWDLEVFTDRFRVILKFGGQPQALVTPFAAITRFYDPSVRFGLQFEPVADEEAKAAVAAEQEIGDEIEEPAPPAAASNAGPGAVVSLDAFRKK
jgi:hypothetical protein